MSTDGPCAQPSHVGCSVGCRAENPRGLVGQNEEWIGPRRGRGMRAREGRELDEVILLSPSSSPDAHKPIIKQGYPA